MNTHESYTRFKRRTRGIGALSLALMLAAGIVVGSATAAADPNAVADAERDRAAQVARLFFAGDLAALQGMMTPEMQAAFSEDAMQSIRLQLEEEQGAFQSLGSAWREDEVQQHVRYRVPVNFERGDLDLRVVFDQTGKLAGLFQLPRLTPPSERPVEPGPRADLEGQWEGTIELPGTSLTVRLDLNWAESAWSGSIDIPMQGAEGLPLDFLYLDADSLELALQGVPGDPTFHGRIEPDKIAGDFTQSGMRFDFELGREISEAPARPQEPQPPFPYRSVELNIDRGEFSLAGTLTLPEGEGPFPAALLISGSGPQDRDETVFEHKPFLVLADHLTRAGIAVLRVDDRGVGESGGEPAGATSADLADDARAELAALKARSEVDPDRMGLIGHSEGALIASMIAAGSDAAAFVVLLAGPGVPGDELLIRQLRLQMRAEGLGDAYSEAAVEEQRALLDLVMRDAPVDSIRAQTAELIRVEASLLGQKREASEAELDAAVSGPLGVASPWYRFFIAYDPGKDLSRIHVPVLALNGSLDTQVDPEQNLPAIRAALEQAGNEDATVEELQGLNHLFQPAETGAVDEYYEIDQTFDPAALEKIGQWILARFSR